MKILLIILALVLGAILFLFVVGVLVMIAAYDDTYREMDDLAQEAYIREWMQEQEVKKLRKKERREIHKTGRRRRGR